MCMVMHCLSAHQVLASSQGRVPQGTKRQGQISTFLQSESSRAVDNSIAIISLNASVNADFLPAKRRPDPDSQPSHASCLSQK
jgi:hypothetical protein